MDPAQLSRADVEAVGRETLFRGFFKVDKVHLRHRRFDGSWTGTFAREIFLRGRAAALLPYDPVRDEVVLIEQFRIGPYAAGRQPWLIEVVGGVIDTEEPAETVALRETREEAGLKVEAVEHVLGFYPSPGGMDEWVDLFCGKVDARTVAGIHGKAEENEDIRPRRVPADRAIAAIGDPIDNAFTIIALQWLALNRDRLRRLWIPAPGAPDDP